VERSKSQNKEQLERQANVVINNLADFPSSFQTKSLPGPSQPFLPLSF
jgi:hypothetical protein